MGRDRLADVRKGAAADGAGADLLTEGDDGHLLPRVVGAPPGRIATVVCRDDGEVAGPQFCLEFGKAPIERLERRRVPGYVATVAEQHVEVDEIDHRQFAVAERIEDI